MFRVLRKVSITGPSVIPAQMRCMSRGSVFGRQFSTNGKPNQNEIKKPPASSIFLSRAAIQEQVRSIVKGLDQFYENRERTSPDEHKKIEEEHLQQLLNQRILRREFINDGAGLTLKYISFMFATSRWIH